MELLMEAGYSPEHYASQGSEYSGVQAGSAANTEIKMQKSRDCMQSLKHWVYPN